MNLDDQKLYQKLDPKGVNKSIEFLPDQIRQVLAESRLIKIPKEYSKISHVVVCGMGGSNIGARILKTALKNVARVPILIEADYTVPEYVSKDTLFIVSSYSGTTEEPLSALKAAKKKGSRILAISSDNRKSKLAKLMMKENIPGYIFDPRKNPANQPRLGLGYTLFGIAVMLAKTGVITITTKEIKNIIAEMELRTRKLRISVPQTKNVAKKIALGLEKKIPTLVAAEHLVGNIKALRNQMSENSKHLPNFLELPDLNHYAMEGLAFPKNSPKIRIFIFFDSLLYHKRIQKRSELTKQIIKKNKIEFIDYQLTGKTKLAESFELLQLGTWITYYLGAIHKVDPVKIPFVEWFKAQLK